MPTRFLVSRFPLNSLFNYSSKVFCDLLTSCRNTRTVSSMQKSDGETPNSGPGLLAIFEKNPKRLQRIRFLARLFKNGGYELRIAGGAVRDILRDFEPQDIDFATTARPEESLKVLGRHENLLRIIVTAAGQKHGTVAVKFKETDVDLKKIKLSPEPGEQGDKESENLKSDNKPEYDDESPFEITTLRCDNITDGRHAEVEFVNDWRKDAERRDLTINAMFLTLDEGKLIDFFGGKSDLKNGIVKFVGNADLRIREDYLRILRYFRFWSRYGRLNPPDSETTAIIKSNLEGLEKISGERLWQEIKKILVHFPCYEVVELMLKLKIFERVGLVDQSIDNYDDYTESVLRELKIVQENVRQFVDIFLGPKSKPGLDQYSLRRTKEILPAIVFSTAVQTTSMCMNSHKRMKYSNLERESILHIIENRTENQSLKELKHQLAMAPTPERNQMASKMRALLIYKGDFELIEELNSWQVPNFPIPGNIVAKEVKKHGLPSDKIKTILQALKNDWATSDYKMSQQDLNQAMTDKLENLKILNKS